MPFLPRTSALSLLATCLTVTSASAQLRTAEFDFENLEAMPIPGAMLEMEDNGLTVLIESGSNSLDIIDAGVDTPAGWGERSLLVTPLPSAASSIVITFVGGVTGFSIEFGDFDSDVDTLVFEAYWGPGASGGLISDFEIEYENTLPDFESTFFSFLAPTNALGSVMITSTSQTLGEQPMVFDNLAVLVPSPATGLILALGVPAFLPRRR